MAKAFLCYQHIVAHDVEVAGVALIAPEEEHQIVAVGGVDLHGPTLTGLA